MLPNSKGLSRKHVMEACHAAMRRLQVDYLDFYFCHRPDPETPIEETVRAMSDLVQQGKVLYWGTSEWSAQEITQAHAIARECHLVPPTMEQPQYNLFHRQRVEIEYARLFAEYGMGATIWSPLASGLLTGKHNKGPQEGTRATLKDYEWLKEQLEQRAREKGEQVQRLERIAQELELSPAVFAIAWCLKNPNVSTVILGASKVDAAEGESAGGRRAGEVHAAGDEADRRGGGSGVARSIARSAFPVNDDETRPVAIVLLLALSFSLGARAAGRERVPLHPALRRRAAEGAADDRRRRLQHGLFSQERLHRRRDFLAGECGL